MRQHKTIRVTFPNQNGDMIAGRLEMPIDEQPTHIGLFSHCFTCSKEFFAPTKVSKALADRGIAMMRFDFTGLGDSEGDFSSSSFSTNIGDLCAGAQFLEDEYGIAPSLLIGHSFGGTTSLAATQHLPAVEAVATIGSPQDPSHVMRHFEQHQQLLERDGFIEIEVAGRKYTLKKSFMDDLGSHDVEKNTRDFDGAVFVFQSPEDDMVDWKNAEVIYERASDPRFLIRMDGVSHMLDRPEEAAMVAYVLSSWLQDGEKPQKVYAS